jgi:hypothetical protein
MKPGEIRTPASHVLHRLTGDLERWGGLFIEVARTRELPTVEQVLGGLVEWMGNDLVDGWLRLPIPVFDVLSEQSEALFQACSAYLGELRGAPLPLSAEARRVREAAIGAVLDRIRTVGAMAARDLRTEGTDGAG